MALLAPSHPAFGKADLSNCEREQIHLPGLIQPFGALLLLREPDLLIVNASLNAAEFLGIDAPPVGLALTDLAGDLAQRIRPHLDESLIETPAAVRCHVGRDSTAYDCQLHRPPGGGIVVELERAGPPVDLSRHVERALRSILACSSLERLCDETARLFRDLTGYDRVMVYRFDAEGHGEIFSERKRGRLESFRGNWYPASDIPQIARRLYERNRVRILVDVAATPVPLAPEAVSPADAPLDMSLCVLRSMSPLHIQYLKNMGVGATLVVSLMVGGKLWGLVACHHYKPRVVHYEVRAVCELLAEAVATRLAALDAFLQAQAELSVRRLEQRLVDAISREGDWRAVIFDKSRALLTPLGAAGVALLVDGEVQTTGEVPGTQQIRAVGGWLDGQPRSPVTATASLRRDAPDLGEVMPEIGGLLAAPISDTPGDYLVWFRPERITTVTWGGNPFVPFTVGNDPLDLSPRRSFAQWHQLVEGTCEPWSDTDLTTGRLIGETVADVVLQFRTVRMLIIQDQLDVVGQKVRSAGQAAVIADAEGRIRLTTGAFDRLLAGRPAPARIEDLAVLFADPGSIARNLKDLVRHRRPWRGEVLLPLASGDSLPLLVRADPVVSRPGRALGTVLLFTDISERRSAEAARRRFQHAIVAPPRIGLRAGATTDPLYRALLSTVIENAQVAALEIADGPDIGRVPQMLDAIGTSANRAAEVLERLIRHANRAAKPEA